MSNNFAALGNETLLSTPLVVDTFNISSFFQHGTARVMNLAILLLLLLPVIKANHDDSNISNSNNINNNKEEEDDGAGTPRFGNIPPVDIR